MTRFLAALALIALLSTLPFVLGAGAGGALINMLIMMLFALAFNLLVGQGGMMSFGHAAYFAFGVFGTLHLMIAVENGDIVFPTPLLPLAGGLAGLIVGLVAGYFATWRSGVYFAMVTLALAELFHLLAPNLEGIFGGEAGISSFRMPFGPWNMGTDIQVYYLTLVWVVVGALMLWLLTRTPFGRLTEALRDNEMRVGFIGFNVHHSKILVFAISAMFSGIAGGLFAVSNESGNYILFGMQYSATVVLATVVGGSGVFLGPALGAALLSLGGFYASEATHVWLLYQGIIFVLVVMFLPQGLAGWLVDKWDRLRDGQGMTMLRNAVAAIPAAICLIGGTVFLLESLATICSREYAAERAVSDGTWPAFHLFGRDWQPDSILTWAIPVLLLGLGALLVTRLTRDDDTGPGPGAGEGVKA